MIWHHIRIISVPVRARYIKIKKNIRKPLKRSFATTPSDFTSDFNRLGVRCHERSKTIFLAKPFFMITPVFEMIEQWFWQYRVCLVKTHRSMHSVTLKGQGQNLSSGQSHVVIQVGHIAYDSMRLERNTIRPLPRLYLFWIKSCSQKICWWT